MIRVLLWGLASIVLQASAATAQERPVLMLDSGGHMGLVSSVVFTPDGKYLVSTGYDKVIRVWDWQAGQVVRVLRGQVGAGDEGRINAVALSPDGRRLAAAGQMALRGQLAQPIRIYDFETGELVQLLTGHTGKIIALAFSPDGMRLLSGSGDRTAVLWDVTTGRLLHRLDRHKAEVYGVGFTPDGARVVTGSFDRMIRLWRSADGRLIAELNALKDYALAVSRKDGTIASGSLDGEIRLWDSGTGRHLSTFKQGRTVVGSLNFSPDGRWLLSTCGGGNSCDVDAQYIWDITNGNVIQAYRGHDNSVLAAAISPDGRLVATGGGDQHEIHIWDLQTGQNKKILRGTGNPVWAAGFAADGSSIAWGHMWEKHDPGNGYGPLQYELRLPGAGSVLGRPERLENASAEKWLRARTKHGPHSLAHAKGGGYGLDAVLRIEKSGKLVARIQRDFSNGYSHRAYGFSPDGETIISGGSNGYLAAYDLQGRARGAYVGHEGDIWAVAISPDGRLLATGAHDQTLRIWNLVTRELIVTLFHGADGDWVLWTPQGYYMGSPGADKLVGWQINKGQDQAAEFVGAEQLRQHLNRPDIVEKSIILASAEQAVREAPGATFRLTELLSRPVPRFKIEAPIHGSTERSGRATVKIMIEATPDPIKAIRVQVNGRQIVEQTPDTGTGGFQPGERTLDVPLAAGRNEVRVTLTNAIGEKAATVTLIHDGEGALDIRGTLFILAVGVDKYPGLGRTCGADGDASCDLRFAGADAGALVAAAEKRLGPAHSAVVKRVLVNDAGASDEPTVTNILDALDLLKQANETDTVLLFISGHGFNDGPHYRFLPTNAELMGGRFRSATVVPWQILQEAVETAKGRRILLIDTCHAANAYNQRLGNAAYHANIIAYTAARFDQEALEDNNLGHGLFTYAVVEALAGKGELAAKRQISTKELAEYVLKRVDELSKKLQRAQEPQYFRGRDAVDYVLARW